MTVIYSYQWQTECSQSS